mmetsp:Transcript_61037/g.109882  ORF Transcript_61037/g.109882 Transcript_61037/m.109882 type:complete len:500 (-) Transcript_61037:345-1844(-)
MHELPADLPLEELRERGRRGSLLALVDFVQQRGRPRGLLPLELGGLWSSSAARSLCCTQGHGARPAVSPAAGLQESLAGLPAAGAGRHRQRREARAVSRVGRGHGIQQLQQQLCLPRQGDVVDQGSPEASLVLAGQLSEVVKPAFPRLRGALGWQGQPNLSSPHAPQRFQGECSKRQSFSEHLCPRRSQQRPSRDSHCSPSMPRPTQANTAIRTVRIILKALQAGAKLSQVLLVVKVGAPFCILIPSAVPLQLKLERQVCCIAAVLQHPSHQLPLLGLGSLAQQRLTSLCKQRTCALALGPAPVPAAQHSLTQLVAQWVLHHGVPALRQLGALCSQEQLVPLRPRQEPAWLLHEEVWPNPPGLRKGHAHVVGQLGVHDPCSSPKPSPHIGIFCLQPCSQGRASTVTQAAGQEVGHRGPVTVRCQSHELNVRGWLSTVHANATLFCQHEYQANSARARSVSQGLTKVGAPAAQALRFPRGQGTIVYRCQELAHQIQRIGR